MPARRTDDPALLGMEGKQNWPHTPWGMDGGRFGKVVDVAVCDPEGNFLFNKPVVEEGPHVITLPYALDPENGLPKLALIREQRDTAAALDGVDSPQFWGPPRGYAEQTDEGLIAAGLREAGEEAGVSVLTAQPWIVATDTNPNETIVRSKSPWIALPIDMTQLSAIQNDRDVKIFKAEFFSEYQLEDMIRAGEYDGASTRSWCLATAVLYFRLFVLPTIVR